MQNSLYSLRRLSNHSILDQKTPLFRCEPRLGENACFLSNISWCVREVWIRMRLIGSIRIAWAEKMPFTDCVSTIDGCFFLRTKITTENGPRTFVPEDLKARNVYDGL